MFDLDDYANLNLAQKQTVYSRTCLKFCSIPSLYGLKAMTFRQKCRKWVVKLKPGLYMFSLDS